MERTIKDGQYVKVVDESGRLHDGLVTRQWGSIEGTVVKDGEAGPCVNVLFVTDDQAKTDPYGLQIERLSSCSHKRSTTAPGRYWYFPDEVF
jgi:hypothetical protein